MEIRTRQSGDVIVLQISGRMDLVSSSTLKDRLHEHLQDGRSLIILNGEGMDFINSSGLGALVSIMKEVRVQKGRLTLSNLATYVQEIFDITQLSHIFEIFGVEEEALASFQPVAAK